MSSDGENKKKRGEVYVRAPTNSAIRQSEYPSCSLMCELTNGGAGYRNAVRSDTEGTEMPADITLADVYTKVEALERLDLKTINFVSELAAQLSRMEQALEANKQALELHTAAVRDSFENDASESVVDPVTPALRTAVQTRSATRSKSVSENTAK